MRILLAFALLACLPQTALAKTTSEPAIVACKNIEDCAKTQTESFYKTYRLERVVDGDTIVASGKKIRLWGINTPEKDDPHFLAAKLLLESLVSKGELSCKFIEKDRYKRDVMHCLIDQLDIGSMMVRAGMARDYDKYSGRYYQYEEGIAKSEKIGIWRESKDQNTETGHEAMCTKEAKQCPDGSYVSRQGAKCEFAPCPK